MIDGLFTKNICNNGNVGFNFSTNPISNQLDFGIGSIFSNLSGCPSFNDEDTSMQLFMSNMSLLNSFLNNQALFLSNNKGYNRPFNTNTNLPQLKDVNVHYSSERGRMLANIASENAIEKNSRHRCLEGVRETLNECGSVNGKLGGSAYQAADMLAKNKNFQEIKVERKDLKELPAGCVIVWDRNYAGTKTSDIHGHITVALGNGSGASDHIEEKLYMLNSQHRVFIPV